MNYTPPSPPELSHRRATPDDTSAPQLAKPHLHELHEASAIPLEVIAERGYRTVSDPLELLSLGFSDYQVQGLPGILIPLHGADGSNGRYALKPDRPRVEHRPDKPDRKIKYEYPAGQRPMLDVPQRCQATLHDPTVPLLFSEGAKKVDCAAGLGYCAVNVWGVHNWYRNPEHGGFPTIEPIPDWDPIVPTLDGRVCYLAFDSDAFSQDKPSVGLAMRRLANFLSRHGALVYIVQLPDAADGAKQGLDDFVASQGAEAFAQLVEDAEPWGSRGVVRKLQAEVRELRQQQSAVAAVLRNPSMRAPDKVVAIATINEAGWRQSAGAETPFTINRERLAEATGLKPDGVGDSLKRLSSGPAALFDRAVTRTMTEDGQYRSVIKITPRHDGGVVGMLKQAAQIAPDYSAGGTKQPWGGRRLACPDHPAAAVVRRSVFACSECGQVLDESTNVLKPPDDVPDVELAAGDDPREGGEVLDRQLAVSAEPHAAAVLDRQDDAPDPGPGGDQGASPNYVTTVRQVAVSEPSPAPPVAWDPAEADGWIAEADRRIETVCPPDWEPDDTWAGLEAAIVAAYLAADRDALRAALHARHAHARTTFATDRARRASAA
jgi:hypothetical protein